MKGGMHKYGIHKWKGMDRGAYFTLLRVKNDLKSGDLFLI